MTTLFSKCPSPTAFKVVVHTFKREARASVYFPSKDKSFLYNQADYIVSLRKTFYTILLRYIKSLNALQNRDPSISLTSFAKFNFVYYHIKGPLANEIFAEHKHFKKRTKKYELPPLYYKL